MFSTPKDNKLNAEKETMVNEGGHAVDDIKDSANQFKSDAKEAAKAMKEDLEGVAHRTGEHARVLADSAGQSVSGILETMTVKIRQKPVQSSAIALGVGVVMGMLYSRR